MSKDFLKEIKSIKNIYGDGKSSIRAYNLIKQIDFKKFIFKTEDPLELQ
jgi:GDP/UDP-N,N'-diacetylbacillosamine 2-epimerase (hydrolysing)